MRIKIYTTLAILFIASLLLWGYYSQKEKSENLPTDNIAKQERIELHFGHQGVEDFNRQQSGMDMHPVGMGFMEDYTYI